MKLSCLNVYGFESKRIVSECFELIHTDDICICIKSKLDETDIMVLRNS